MDTINEGEISCHTCRYAAVVGSNEPCQSCRRFTSWAPQHPVNQPGPSTKLTGGSSDYYKVDVKAPATEGTPPYTAECIDIIEALNLNFAEGNILKAIWRSAGKRLGGGKPGTSALYDAEKVRFFGDRLVAQLTLEESE